MPDSHAPEREPIRYVFPHWSMGTRKGSAFSERLQIILPKTIVELLPFSSVLESIYGR